MDPLDYELIFDLGKRKPARPILGRAFDVNIDWRLDRSFIWTCLMQIVSFTRGQVGFVEDLTRVDEFHIRLGTYEEMTWPNGQVNAGDCQAYYNNHIITGGLLRLHPDWAHEPKVVIHELGHLLGFFHTQQPGPHMMGGAPLGSWTFSAEEQYVWDWHALQQYHQYY